MTHALESNFATRSLLLKRSGTQTDKKTLDTLYRKAMVWLADEPYSCYNFRT